MTLKLLYPKDHVTLRSSVFGGASSSHKLVPMIRKNIEREDLTHWPDPAMGSAISHASIPLCTLPNRGRKKNQFFFGPN